MSMEWKWKSCYMLCGTHIACSIFHLKPVPGDRAGDTQIHAIGLQFFFSRWLLPFDFHCSFSISCSKYKYAPFYPFFVTILHSCLPCDYLFIYSFVFLFIFYFNSKPSSLLSSLTLTNHYPIAPSFSSEKGSLPTPFVPLHPQASSPSRTSHILSQWGQLCRSGRGTGIHLAWSETETAPFPLVGGTTWILSCTFATTVMGA